MNCVSDINFQSSVSKYKNCESNKKKMFTSTKYVVKHTQRQTLMSRLCIKYQEEINVNMKMQVKEIVNTEVKFKLRIKERRSESKKCGNILQ